MSEIDLIGLIGTNGFSIAVAIYLLYERTSTFKQNKEEFAALQDRVIKLSETVLEVVKSNTAGYVQLTATITRLCDKMEGKA